MLLRRVGSAVAVVAAANFFHSRSTCAGNDSSAWPFDTKGFPSFTPNFPFAPKGHPLYLIGAGMRRKNLYIMEVDVYLVGLALSEQAIQTAANWPDRKNTSVLSTFLLDNNYVSLTRPDAKDPRCAIFIKFVRTATKAQFLAAFKESFSDFEPTEFSEFNSILENVVGDNMATGDEFSFYWLNNGEIVIAKNGVVGGRLTNEKISQRLLDVYTDPKRAVSPEMYRSVEDNFAKIAEIVKTGELAPRA